jgi:hypothetical protein
MKAFFLSSLGFSSGQCTTNLSTIGLRSFPVRDKEVTRQKDSTKIYLASGLQQRILEIKKWA